MCRVPWKEEAAEPHWPTQTKVLAETGDALVFQRHDCIQGRQLARVCVDALHHDVAPVQRLPATRTAQSGNRNGI